MSSTETLLLAVIHKRDEQMRVLRNTLSGYVPSAFTASQLLHNIQMLCTSYGRTQVESPTNNNTPHQRNEIAVSTTFNRLYPLSSTASRIFVHPSTQGGSNSEVLWIVQQVFIDATSKFIQSFIEQKLSRPVFERFVVGDHMHAVALHVFNITLPSSMPRDRILLEMNDNCDSGIRDTPTLVSVAMKKLAMMRWEADTAEPNHVTDIQLLYSLADCFALAYRWNRFSTSTTMIFENEFHTLYAPTHPPFASNTTRPLEYIRPQAKLSHQPLTILRRSMNIVQLQAAKEQAEIQIAKCNRAIIIATAAAVRGTESIMEEDEEDSTIDT